MQHLSTADGNISDGSSESDEENDGDGSLPSSGELPKSAEDEEPDVAVRGLVQYEVKSHIAVRRVGNCNSRPAYCTLLLGPGNTTAVRD